MLDAEVNMNFLHCPNSWWVCHVFSICENNGGKWKVLNTKEDCILSRLGIRGAVLEGQFNVF